MGVGLCRRRTPLETIAPHRNASPVEGAGPETIGRNLAQRYRAVETGPAATETSESAGIDEGFRGRARIPIRMLGFVSASSAVPLFMWRALTIGGILFLIPVGVKAGLDWPLPGGSQVSKARPGAPFAFPGLNRFGTPRALASEVPCLRFSSAERLCLQMSRARWEDMH